MEMGFINIVGVFCGAVAGAAQVTDNVHGLNNGTFLQVGLIRIIFPEVGVIVIPLLVKAPDTQPPAAVLIPADSFHSAGLYGNNGGSSLA